MPAQDIIARLYVKSTRRHAGCDGDVQGGEELFDVGLGHVEMRRDANPRPAPADEHVLRTERPDNIPGEPVRQARTDDVRAALR